MTDTQIPAQTVAGPVYSVPQQRKIVTAIPGPKSQQLHDRRSKVVSAGVSSALPVYIEHANGAILVDVDGNQFIDFGAGIGVTTVGHTESRVVEAAAAQLQDVIHTLFTITPYEEYVRVAELLAEHTPGNWQKKTRARELGRRGRRERREDRPQVHRPPRRRGARPRLPRPHQPHHGHELQGDALRERLRPARGRRLPRAELVPLPRRALGRRRRGPHHRLPREDRRRERPRVPRRRAHPGRGRLHGPRRRLPPDPAGVVHRERRRHDRRRDPVGHGPHRPLLRERALRLGARPRALGEGHRGRPAARRGHRPRRDHGRLAPRRTRRHVRRQPRRVRRGDRRVRVDRAQRPARRGPAHRGDPHRRPRAAQAALRHHRRHPRQGRDDRHRTRAARHPRHHEGSRTPTRSARSSRSPRSTACCSSARAPTATCCASCRASR